MVTELNTEKFEQSVQGWISIHQLTLKKRVAYKMRLDELESWDDCRGNEFERKVKIESLKRLLNDGK